jgi:DNA-binding PadR family transcriptional regulator
LLLELLRAPSYGYDLIRRLADYGFRRASSEPGVVYKVLRALEDAGSIRSEWSPQESGPARRYYEITASGRDVLHRRLYHLRRYLERVEKLVAAYSLLTGDDLRSDGGTDEAEAVAPARSRRLTLQESRASASAVAVTPSGGN